MKVKLITAPTLKPVSVMDVKAHLRITTNDDDVLLTAYIDSAIEEVEAWTRRAIMTQVWEYYLDDWPEEDYILIPFGNLHSDTKATGTITAAGNVANNETVTVGTKVYTFRNLPLTEGHIDVGATAAISLDNLKKAINHTGDQGVDYVLESPHPTVVATTNTDTVQTLESRIGGFAGNLIALATDAAQFSVGAAFLAGGITGATVSYKDSDSLETFLDPTDDYTIEECGPNHGTIYLAYGETWPSFTPYPSHPITIQFTCGWTTAALVPAKIKSAIKFLVAQMYEDRGENVVGSGLTVTENKTVERLLASERLWGEF